MIFSNVVGIDGGINFIAATYDSKRKSTFVNGRAVKQKRAHYKKIRQQLQKVQTPSSRRRLKAIGNQENRWIRSIAIGGRCSRSCWERGAASAKHWACVGMILIMNDVPLVSITVWSITR